MNKLLIIFTGLITLAILGYFCIYYKAPYIQNDIHNRTSIALAEQDLDNVVIDTIGRDIILTGSVVSEAIRKQVEDHARSIYGVNMVDNQLAIAASEPITEPIFIPDAESEATTEQFEE